jgi:hypothetical protein
MYLGKNSITFFVILVATNHLVAKAVEPQPATLPQPHIPRIHVPRIPIPAYPVSIDMRKLFPCLHKDPPTRPALISHAIRIPDIFKLPQRVIGARRLTPPVLSKHQTSWAPITTLETPSLRALITAVRIASQYYSVILGPRQVRRSCAGANMLFTVGVKNRRMDR